MSIKLPPLMAAFIQAKNDYDSAAFTSCFADDAIVHDEGQEIRGTAAIKKWIEDSNEKYRDTLTVTDFAGNDHEMILTARVSGNFDGSPVVLDFCFTVSSGKIARLSVKLADN